MIDYELRQKRNKMVKNLMLISYCPTRFSWCKCVETHEDPI